MSIDRKNPKGYYLRQARKDDTFSSSSAVYVNGSFHFGWVFPPPVGSNSQRRHIYCSLEGVALTPLLR